MIVGVSKDPVPYILEAERMVKKRQSVFWVMPKDGHDANQSAQRYARAEKQGRKGRRELDVDQMDISDIEEFISIVVKVRWFQFSDTFPELASQINQGPDGKNLEPGVFFEITDKLVLEKVAMQISPDHMIEIFEVANDISRLKNGEKKGSSSSPTLSTGNPSKKTETETTTATSV